MNEDRPRGVAFLVSPDAEYVHGAISPWTGVAPAGERRRADARAARPIPVAPPVWRRHPDLLVPRQAGRRGVSRSSSSR
jgi:hypothetical protein